MNEAEFKAALQELSEYLVEILTEEQAVIVSMLLGNLIRSMGYPKDAN